MKALRFDDDLWGKVAPTAHPTHRVYLAKYLGGLACKWVLVEEKYFDRDYLAEFYAFYGGCANRYSHESIRLHFFAGETPPLDSQAVARLMSGDPALVEAWQARYLGFSVIRPIPGAPFGRTILPLWPERDQAHARVECASRAYGAHVCGIPLRVHRGLAWQQQDSGVGACATVSLWSMLHSVAHHEGLKIPTTVEITRAATRHSVEIGRVFPSDGLSVYQICEAIRFFELSPLVVEGDLAYEDARGTELRVFSRERFTTYLATLMRAGFPVLIGGCYDLGGDDEGDHAICAVGFRASTGPALGRLGDPTSADSSVDYIYVHNDNIGPAVKCSIRDSVTATSGTAVSLEPAPDEVWTPKGPYKPIVPFVLVAAVPPKMRAAPGELLDTGLNLASDFMAARPSAAIEFSAFICKQADYFGPMLERALSGDRVLLTRTRLGAMRILGAMSRYLGVVRLTNDARPLVDLLWDTTDVRANEPLLGSVSFDASAHAVVNHLMDSGLLPSKKREMVEAFRR